MVLRKGSLPLIQKVMISPLGGAGRDVNIRTNSTDFMGYYSKPKETLLGEHIIEEDNKGEMKEG